MQTNKALHQKLARITHLVNVLYNAPPNDYAPLISTLYQAVHEDGPFVGVQNTPPANQANPANNAIPPTIPPADYIHYINIAGQWRQAVGFRQEENNGNQ